MTEEQVLPFHHTPSKPPPPLTSSPLTPIMTRVWSLVFLGYRAEEEIVILRRDFCFNSMTVIASGSRHSNSSFRREPEGCTGEAQLDRDYRRLSPFSCQKNWSKTPWACALRAKRVPKNELPHWGVGTEHGLKRRRLLSGTSDMPGGITAGSGIISPVQWNDSDPELMTCAACARGG